MPSGARPFGTGVAVRTGVGAAGPTPSSSHAETIGSYGMTALRRTSALWITALLTAGGLLALALLAQTILNYRYVSSSLIRQEARRTAEERVRNVERSCLLYTSPSPR